MTPFELDVSTDNPVCPSEQWVFPLSWLTTDLDLVGLGYTTMHLKVCTDAATPVVLFEIDATIGVNGLYQGAQATATNAQTALCPFGLLNYFVDAIKTGYDDIPLGSGQTIAKVWV